VLGNEKLATAPSLIPPIAFELNDTILPKVGGNAMILTGGPNKFEKGNKLLF